MPGKWPPHSGPQLPGCQMTGLQEMTSQCPSGFNVSKTPWNCQSSLIGLWSRKEEKRREAWLLRTWIRPTAQGCGPLSSHRISPVAERHPGTASMHRFDRGYLISGWPLSCKEYWLHYNSFTKVELTSPRSPGKAGASAVSKWRLICPLPPPNPNSLSHLPAWIREATICVKTLSHSSYSLESWVPLGGYLWWMWSAISPFKS